MHRFLCLAFCLAVALPPGRGAAGNGQSVVPDAERIASLLPGAEVSTVERIDEGVPGWTVRHGEDIVGYVGSTWEIVGSVGYSGRPLDVLVAVSPDGHIAGAELVRQSEPVLTLGVSDADIAAYVAGFRGYDLAAPAGSPAPGLPDIISRATVSTGVIRDGILRSARTLALARGVLGEAGGVDRIGFRPMGWDELVATGAVRGAAVSMADAARALAGAKVQVEPGPGDFLRLWVALADPPTIGQNLLGQQDYTRAVGALPPGRSALIVMSAGVQSHRGTDWRRTGQFDRLVLRQGDLAWQPDAAGFHMVRRLALPDAPAMKEISVFALPEGFDATRPFTVAVRATRPAASGGDVSMRVDLDYDLPGTFRLAPPAAEAPLWQQAWTTRRTAVVLVGAMLAVLTVALFAQEWITRRPRLWRTARLMFLATTFLVLGLGLGGQLSVVQVVAFVQSLLTGFRWETFLIEPVIFLLWAFVALGLLFWGRGVYCGWLCPFGALQELMNAAAVRLGLRQIAVPQALHERLWVIKYTLFVAILALSFYSMHDALVLAEAEPFKTAIAMRFVRAWPFLLFVAGILAAGLFIERFYCRYLCPLGAALAVPAKLKIFDWLHRRPQCGRECRLCETRCTVGAIDAIGRINPNECVLCLRCQVIMNDAAQCPVLKRRARAPEGATP
jgi:NosR/NirI family nitrite reductase transcriptional regulator